MAAILVTFLGGASLQADRYRATRYDFGDGGAPQQPPLAFFGWALRERLRPQRLVVLGTAGSMWDHLFEGDLAFAAEAEETRIELVAAVERRAVPQGLLEALQAPLAARLGCAVRLQLIPYCRDAAEQVELLRILALGVEPGDDIDLDVTHGFRHLPMLALLAALYLRRVNGAQVRRIWYAAYDPDTDKAPVHDLSGLLRIADWLDALAVYDHSGDYGAFADLLGAAVGAPLREAAFFESVNRVGQARGKARAALDALAAAPLLDPAAALFSGDLAARLAWARQEQFYRRQRVLALQHLRRRQYLPAILSGYEAFVSHLCHQEGRNPDSHAERKQVQETFDTIEKTRRPRSTRYRAWDTLRRLRNAVAHGTQPQGAEVQRALADREEMHRQLDRLFESLLPEQP